MVDAVHYYVSIEICVTRISVTICICIALICVCNINTVVAGITDAVTITGIFLARIGGSRAVIHPVLDQIEVRVGNHGNVPGGKSKEGLQGWQEIRTTAKLTHCILGSFVLLCDRCGPQGKWPIRIVSSLLAHPPVVYSTCSNGAATASPS